MLFFKVWHQVFSGSAIMQDEGRIFKDIEEEVQKILSERRRVEEALEEASRIHYFKSLDPSLRGFLEKISEREVVLIALREEALSKSMEDVKKILEDLKDERRMVYLIRWPTLLIVGRDVELVVHEG